MTSAQAMGGDMSDTDVEMSGDLFVRSPVVQIVADAMSSAVDAVMREQPVDFAGYAETLVPRDLPNPETWGEFVDIIAAMAVRVRKAEAERDAARAVAEPSAIAEATNRAGWWLYNHQNMIRNLMAADNDPDARERLADHMNRIEDAMQDCI